MSNKSKVELHNWDPKARYEYGVGVGFFFDGLRRVTRKGEYTTIPADPEKRFSTIDRTLGVMVECADKVGKVPFVFYDDCSPVHSDVERIKAVIGDHPLLYFRAPKNLGVGGRDNIIQRVLGERCEFPIRFDDDVLMDPFDFNDIRAGFDALPDAWGITSCITYFARVEAAQLPEGERYFSGSNLADFVAMRGSIFQSVGYTDPDLRYNEDGEFRLRVQGALGMKCYVDTRLTGKAAPSGAGTNFDKRIEAGQYVEATRPYVKVVYPKGRSPRFSLNKKLADEARLFYVPAHPYAELLAKRVWK